MFKALQQLLGCKKDVAVEEKAEVKEMPKPTREQILDVLQKFKLSAFNSIDVSPNNESVVAYFQKLGLVSVTSEHFLDVATGKIGVRKTAKWNSWDCSWCVNFYVGDKTVEWGLLGNKTTYRNIALCKKGHELQFRDFMKGKRCVSFMPKKLVEALGDGVE
jgi:hypothetical protein